MNSPVFHFHSSRNDAASQQWQSTHGTPTLLLRGDWHGASLADLRDGKVIRSWNTPLDAIEWIQDDGLSAAGRWAGYLSYDLGYLFESIGTSARDDLQLPLFIFAFFPHGAPDIHPEFQETLSHGAPDVHPGFQSTFTRNQYESAIEKCKAYIAAGDVFQINLSQRFTFPVRRSPADIYQNLLHQAPAAYGAMLDFGEFALVSNSPELFLKVEPLAHEQRRIITRPIKGTRPFTLGMEAELRDSVKDQAELNMIVDLERNDLGRICRIGSVCVSEPRRIEAHPTIYHGVATIEGLLRSEVQFGNILRAMFPGGSVTGAPKIRAMQIVDEIEPVRRGPYCGAIGYLDSDGSMQFNLAIRTIIVKDGKAHISVGGGIVADSVAADEYDETLIKAQAMFRAVGVTDLHH